MALEEAKNVAEKKYDEINEQNKILHSRLEALHFKLAEKHRDYAGISTGRTAHALPDAELQNVVNYLRGSKEIAETEIPLLKQEKLRMPSQLGCLHFGYKLLTCIDIRLTTSLFHQVEALLLAFFSVLKMFFIVGLKAGRCCMRISTTHLRKKFPRHFVAKGPDQTHG